MTIECSLKNVVPDKATLVPEKELNSFLIKEHRNDKIITEIISNANLAENYISKLDSLYQEELLSIIYGWF